MYSEIDENDCFIFLFIIGYKYSYSHFCWNRLYIVIQGKVKF